MVDSWDCMNRVLLGVRDRIREEVSIPEGLRMYAEQHRLVVAEEDMATAVYVARIGDGMIRFLGR